MLKLGRFIHFSEAFGLIEDPIPLQHGPARWTNFKPNLCIISFIICVISARIFFHIKSAVFLLFYSLFPGSPQGNLCTHVGTLLNLFAINFIAVLNPNAREIFFDQFCIVFNDIKKLVVKRFSDHFIFCLIT